MNNYPADVRNYDYDPRSPFYEDLDEGLEEMSDDELIHERALAESASEDADVSRKNRHQAEKYLSAINSEIKKEKYMALELPENVAMQVAEQNQKRQLQASLALDLYMQIVARRAELDSSDEDFEYFMELAFNAIDHFAKRMN